MNHKQKFFYTLLGAGIMALGIIIGQIITPDIEAQNNGVFDEITCRSLNVVDENGNRGIFLLATEDLNTIHIGGNNPGGGGISLTTRHFEGTDPDNSILIHNEAGNTAIKLEAKEHQNYVQVFDNAGKEAIILRSHENANSILVFDTAGEPAILLSAIESENNLFVVRKGGEGSVKLVGTKDRSGVSIADSKTEQIRLMAFEDVNTIFLMGKAGEESIGLLGSKKMVSFIRITDRTGNPVWSTPYRKD